MPAVGTVTVASGATLAVNVGGPGEWTSSDVDTDFGSLAGLFKLGTGGQGTPNQVVWTSGSNLGIDTSNAGGSVTYAGVIGQFALGGDTHGLAKNGSGTLVLTANNTYTGGTALNGGTLALGSSGAIGSVGTISFGGGTLQFSTSNTTDYSARFSTAAGQAYSFDTNGESVTLATALTSSGGSLAKLGAGTLSLTGANTYTGKTSVSGGTLEFATIGNVGGGASNLGAPTTVANGTIALSGGGTLRYTGSGASTNRVLNFNGAGTGGTIDASGSGAITFTGDVNATAGGNKTLTLRGTNTGDNTISGIIRNGGGGLVAGTTGVTKEDAGKWILSGANTYTGATTVTAGTLLVNGSLASGSAVAVNGGVLGGTGTIGGAVTVASGGTLSPGASIESLDVGSLAMNGGKLVFELGAPGSPGVTSDLLNVVDTNGLSITSGTVDLIDFGGLAGGTYTLVEYAGTALGNATVDLLTLGLQPAGFTYDLVDNATNLSIDLIVTSAGVPGDHNGDGKVDAADYVVWRKNPGGFPPNAYDLWRANFGNPPGSGSAFGGNSAVPEPAAGLLLVVAGLVALAARCRR
jgi:autotransporter-associated beta strand protein